MKETSEHYNKIYSENKEVFGAGKPLKIVEQIPNIISKGSVLDVGAGQGRNALFSPECFSNDRTT